MSTLARTYEVAAAWPESSAQSREVAAGAATQGFPFVVAMGGDGLVCHVGGGIMDSPVALGIIPVGTANMLARSLGLPMRPRAAAELLAGRHTLRPIPVARLLDHRGAIVGQALSQFGMGFDALVAAEVERHRWAKRWLPNLLYATVSAWIVASERRRINDMRLGVQADHMTHDAVTVMVQVRHPYAYLGPLPLRLTPTPTNGCDVLLAERCGPLVFLQTVARMVAGPGTVASVSGVAVWPDCARLTIQARHAVPCQADGELLGDLDRVEVHSVPDSLRVVVPWHPAAGIR